MSDEKIEHITTFGWVFLHIPKTGGTWIRENFNENELWKKLGRRHMTLGETPQEVLDTNDVFAIARHPVTLLQSWWDFVAWRLDNYSGDPGLVKGMCNSLMRYTNQQPVDPIDLINMCWDPCINKFFENIIERCPSVVDKLYGHMTSGKRVHRWLRTETLLQDTTELLHENGVDAVNEDWILPRNRRESYGRDRLTPLNAETIAYFNKETMTLSGAGRNIPTEDPRDEERPIGYL